MQNNPAQMQKFVGFELKKIHFSIGNLKRYGPDCLESTIFENNRQNHFGHIKLVISENSVFFQTRKTANLLILYTKIAMAR